MSLVREFMQWISSFAVQQTILSLVLVTGLMMAIEERRVSVFAFLGQYALLSLLLAGRVYQPVAALKGAIGVPISMILYISASHVERRLREVRAALKEEGNEEPTGWGRALRERIRRSRVRAASEERDATFPAMQVSLTGMSSSFRILVVALGAVGAYGLWQAHPITLLSPQISLACYFLVATGLLLAATSQDPLRIGIGLLTLLNGFEIAYYTLNTSLMLVGLMGAGEILIALAASNAAERWRIGVSGSERR